MNMSEIHCGKGLHWIAEPPNKQDHSTFPMFELLEGLCIAQHLHTNMWPHHEFEEIWRMYYGKETISTVCSRSTARKWPWCFCWLFVVLHSFLQHFVCFSPCLWYVFDLFVVYFFPFLIIVPVDWRGGVRGIMTSFHSRSTWFETVLIRHSWCYIVTCLGRTSHALDATLVHFFLGDKMRLMPRC